LVLCRFPDLPINAMPIYAYQCESCGHAKDVLQKISDAPLTDCPVCGAATFRKQLTAAGFQLKGSGWYATDFRNNGGGKPAAAAAGAAAADTATAAPASEPAAGGSTGATAAATPCGGACACH
jgi:putative FmdB family regulatory protein